MLHSINLPSCLLDKCDAVLNFAELDIDLIIQYDSTV